MYVYMYSNTPLDIQSLKGETAVLNMSEVAIPSGSGHVIRVVLLVVEVWSPFDL